MIKLRSDFWRRRRHQQYSHASTTDRKRKLFELLVLLAGLGILHMIAMRVFEGLSWGDAAWLTMTTMTTVGYGDMSAETLYGRWSTVLMMYLAGIFLLAQIAGEFIDYRIDRQERMRKGLWSWKMKNHIVIINTPDKDGSRYLQTLVEQVRKSTSLEEYPIQIFSPNFPEGFLEF